MEAANLQGRQVPDRRCAASGMTCDNLAGPAIFALPAAAATLLLSAPAAAQDEECGRDCLAGLAQAYMTALVAKDPSTLPWAEQVRFTENGVPMMIGEGLWGSVSAASEAPLVIADERTDQVVWLGLVEEHGLPAYYAMRLKAEDGRISEVETMLGREGAPGPFTDTAGYAPEAALGSFLGEGEGTRRRRMLSLVHRYFDTREQNDGAVETRFSPTCAHVVNGVSMTEGDYWSAQAAQGCAAQYALGVWRPVDRIRDRRAPVVDVDRGLVAAISFEDHAARYVDYQTTDGRLLSIEIEYPNTRGVIQVFKIVDGEIERIEGVSAFLPYYMRSAWTEEP
jgi:hypothetical protein